MPSAKTQIQFYPARRLTDTDTFVVDECRSTPTRPHRPLYPRGRGTRPRRLWSFHGGDLHNHQPCNPARWLQGESVHPGPRRRNVDESADIGQSFPSGHSSREWFPLNNAKRGRPSTTLRARDCRLIRSVSFAGLGFLSCYLAGKMHLWDKHGHRVSELASITGQHGSAARSVAPCHGADAT